jgi:hypothetical protein
VAVIVAYMTVAELVLLLLKLLLLHHVQRSLLLLLLVSVRALDFNAVWPYHHWILLKLLLLLL